MRFIAVLALTICASGQVTRSFEVASIRVQPGPVRTISITTSGNRLRVEASMTAGLIMYAYNIRNYQLDRGSLPNVVGDTMYDIEAKADGETAPTRDEFRLMMQSLLADRFHLKVHRTLKEMLVYALVPGRNGPKFKESKPDADPTVHVKATGSNYQFYELFAPKETMDDLANTLWNYVDLPVLNKTGLGGTYDIKLNYTPQFKLGKGPELDANELSVFTAVQEQLGLKLESQKSMVEVLVIDHIEKPSEN